MTNSPVGKLLIISMEYTQEEVNEPINIDILLSCIPKHLFLESNISVAYRDLDDKDDTVYDQYSVVLISSKVSSYLQLDRVIKSITHGIVIVGGIMSICCPQELAKAYPNVIFNTGEAETNLSALLSLAVKSSSIGQYKQEIINSNIPNVCFALENSFDIYTAKKSVCNLEQQPPLPHSAAGKVIQKNGLIRMETSRGCPWNKCAFCIMPWKFCEYGWRSFSEKKIETELITLCNCGANRIFFTDEDFIGNAEHIKMLCSVIKRVCATYNTQLKFGGSTSVLTLYKLGNERDMILSDMLASGIDYLFLGIESGSESQLIRYRKGCTPKMNLEALLLLRRCGFILDLGFIMFDADTTIDELRDNLAFIKKANMDNSTSRFAKKLRITPHTAFFEDYQRRGLLTSGLNLNELYYDYRFANDCIDVIYRFVEKCDSLILNEAYKLQATVRTADSDSHTNMALKRLAELRQSVFDFLVQCIEISEHEMPAFEEKVTSIYCQWEKRWLR